MQDTTKFLNVSYLFKIMGLRVALRLLLGWDYGSILSVFNEERGLEEHFVAFVAFRFETSQVEQ